LSIRNNGDIEAFIVKYFSTNIPCSFSYNGTSVKNMFGTLTEQKSNDWTKEYTRTLDHPDQRLKAVLHVKQYESAVEWWVTLEAISEYDTDIISSFSYADIQITTERIDMAVQTEYPCIHYSNGSRASADDFMPFVRNFWPFPKDAYRFACEGGRSSSGCMPYFNLQLTKTSGIIFAIGWSGQWQLDVYREDSEDATAICLDGQMDNTNFRLLSGEKLTMPRMLAVLWEGSLADSFNQFRSFMWRESPLNKGNAVDIPICFAAWGGFKSTSHLRYIDLIKKNELPVNTYWIDAGWFGEGNESSSDDYRDNWYYNVGAWNALQVLYPNGMKEVSDAAQQADMSFLLWFEAERAVSRLRIVDEHREYFIGPKLPFDERFNHETNSTPYSLMLNLGYEPARRWITEALAEHIEKEHIKTLRIDFNYHPLPYWQYADTADRQGISEIKYIGGLYAMMDELLDRFPGLLIDNCASGGRRLDYEMYRRSIPLFRTDYFCIPDRKAAAVQIHTDGISRWMPIHGTSAGNESTHRFSTYFFRSHLAPAVAFDVPDNEMGMSENHRAWYQKMLNEARRAQPYMVKDYYPLTGCSLSEKDWYAYQMHDPQENAGVVIGFRRAECAAEGLEVALAVLDDSGKYAFEDADTGESWIAAGTALKSFRLEATEKGQSRLIFYNKVK